MVMDYGMSRLGRVNFRESNRSPFLVSGSGEIGQARMHSEQTAREIDEEVRRIIDEAMEKVRQILAARKASLQVLAKRLIEREVIDATELKEVIEQTSPSPLLVPGTTADAEPPLRPASGRSPPAARNGGRLAVKPHVSQYPYGKAVERIAFAIASNCKGAANSGRSSVSR